MPTEQIDEANELLRAALDIIRGADWSAYRVTTKANGGGDGMCVAQEIEDYFSIYDVPREPQFPAEDE